MPVEFIGTMGTRPVSELEGPAILSSGGTVDPTYIRHFTRFYEEGEFDSVLLNYNSPGLDNFSIARYAASVTKRLHFAIAHNPALISPILAAQKAANLDHLTNGRIALQFATGGNGDWGDRDSRYHHTDEYLDIVRKVWESEEPFNWEGKFYRFKNAFSEIKPLQKPHIPIYFSGSSSLAVTVGAKHSDLYMMTPEPIAALKKRIAEVKAAAPAGKPLRFSLSLRPILASTEEKAWERADYILSQLQKNPVDLERLSKTAALPSAMRSPQLLDFPFVSENIDKCLWMPLTTSHIYGNATALVGTPQQVAKSLIHYWEAGITSFVMSGFDPIEDAIAYGRDLIPLVRKEIARRDRQTARAA